MIKINNSPQIIAPINFKQKRKLYFKIFGNKHLDKNQKSKINNSLLDIQSILEKTISYRGKMLIKGKKTNFKKKYFSMESLMRISLQRTKSNIEN